MQAGPENLNKTEQKSRMRQSIRQNSRKDADQPQHQQVCRVKRIEEPLGKAAPPPGTLPIVKVEDDKPGSEDGHRAADGFRQRAAAKACHAAIEHCRRGKGKLLARAGIPRVLYFLRTSRCKGSD